MQKQKKIRWLALVCCLLFLLAGQTAAFGAVPYEVELDGGMSGVHLTYTAGNMQNKNLTMKIKNVDANDLDNVTFSFPGNYFTVVNAVAGGQTGNVQGNVVNFEKIKPTTEIVTNSDGSTTEVVKSQDIQVTFTVAGNQTTATTEPQTELVTVTYGGSNQAKTVEVKVVVEPDLMDIAKTSFKITYEQYHKQPYLNEEPALALATVIANFSDKYGNPTQKWPTGKSLYIAAEGVAGFAEITQTVSNGSFREVNDTSGHFYEASSTTASQMVFQVKGQLGSSYSFALGLGDKESNNGSTIKSYFSNGITTPIDYKVAKLNITGIDVNTHNDGQIKIDVSIPNYDLTGKTVEVKLPANFVTKETKENGLITINPNGSLFADVVSVPIEGIYNYTNTDGDYKLYIDGVEYMLTNYDGCVIVVQPSLLTVSIDNELEFRHGTGDAVTAPQELTFTVSGIDTTQVDKIEFKLKSLLVAEESTGSAEMVFKDDRTGRYILDIDENMVIVSGQFNETQTFTFPVDYDNVALTKQEGLNEVYLIEIITRKSSGDQVEKSNNVQLRYRITDTVINVSKTEFTDFRTVSVIGNQCAVEIKMTIDEPELNGRGVYLWITDEYGNIMNVKDRFDIQLVGEAADYLFLMNTELAAVEGSSKGDRNVFRIFKKGADTTVSSIEEDGPNLEIDEMLFRITSSLDGNYRLNIATGRTAQEALANSETVGTLNHKESDIFTFVQESDLPLINIRNFGEIYYNYAAAGLEKPGPGVLEIEIANIEFPEDPSVPDNVYIRLPAALKLYAESDEKYGKYNEGGCLKLNQNNALPKDENSGKKHYKWQIPLAEIDINAFVEEDVREKAGDRVVDATELTFYRGMNVEKKQEIQVNIETGLVFKSFIANLYQFLQASFGSPTHPGEDISLTIVPQETIYTSEIFNNSTGILFWFSNGQDSILTADQVTVKATTLDAEGKEVTNDLKPASEIAGNQNKFKLDWKKETGADQTEKILPGVLAETLAVQFKTAGEYQLNIALLPLDTPVLLVDDEETEENTPVLPNPATDIAVPNTTATMFVQVKVSEKPTEPEKPEVNETWDLALTVDGTAYTATDHVYTITGKKIGEKIALAGKLTDKEGKPLVGVSVNISGEVWTYTGNPSAVTSDTGEFAFEISATNEGTPHLLTLALNSKLESNAFETTYSLKITVTDGSTEETLGEYTVEKVKVVSTVSVDDMAVVYLDVFDKDNKRINITSNSQAQGIFSEIEFRDLPDRSELYKTDIFVRANNGGIEVYFYPDYRGDYYIRMVTASKEAEIINASFEAVWQNEVVDIQLLYPEKTLGIGQTSSAAQIVTYDKNGVEAEVAIVKSGWEYYYQGNAALSIDEWGRLTLRDNERYIGSTVSVTVYNSRYGLTATYTFNVSDKSQIEEDNGLDVSGIVLADDYGAVGQTNQYQFYLVDRNGFTVELAPGQMSSFNGAEASVTVYSKPYGANVNAYISNNGQSMEDNGFGYLYVDCDREGTVRLNVNLKIYDPRTVNNYTYNQYKYYSKTINLEMKEKANVNQAISTDKTFNQSGKKYDTSVAIFLGTNHYRVNMNDKVGEAKPLLRDGKIMVPVRTLAEALGGRFEFNEEKKTITIKVNGDWAVATLGSNIIKTNYGSYYSDIMPFTEGGYTYLPLRTAAEVLGCEVEAVCDVEGNVIGAVFLR